MITATDIWFRYNPSTDWILKHISFEVQKGGCTLIGPNGSGKTTLLRVLTNFLTPQKGQVEIDGKKIGRTRDLVGKIGYVPTNPLNMLTGPTVEEDIRKAAKISGKSSSKILTVFGLNKLKHKKIYKLSQGQQKLLALASAYAINPEILLLDEPSIGLDREKRRTLMKVISEITKEGIVITATNDMRVATKIPHSILLSNGKLLTKGKTRDVLYELGEKEEILPNEIVSFAKKLKEKGVKIGRPLTPKELARNLSMRL